MRKAGKKRIKAALKQCAEWRASMQPRIDALELERARTYITKWADDVRARIEAGDLGICTTALAASVRRDIEAWESGYYTGFTESGGRRVA